MDAIEYYSPDKKHKLIFDNFIEPKMCMNMSRFSLADIQLNRVEKFIPLWAVYSGELTSWSENANYFSIPIASPFDGFFIYNIQRRQYAFIKVANSWVLAGHCHEEHIDIEYRDDQIPERVEHNKYPTKIFSKPPNLQFRFSEISWTEVKQIQHIKEESVIAPLYDLQPIDNGWRQFKGQFPQTTEVLVWELRKFAKYGDEQSLEWLSKIQAKTKDVNNWVNASHYLGMKKRKEKGRTWLQKLFGLNH